MDDTDQEIRFETDALADRLRQASDELEGILCGHNVLKSLPECLPGDFDEESAITGSTALIELCLTSVDSAFDTTVDEFIGIAEELRGAELIDRGECRSAKRTQVRIDCEDMEGEERIQKELRESSRVVHHRSFKGGVNYEVALMKGPALLNFAVAREGGYDDLNPPWWENDILLEVSYDGPGDSSLVTDLIEGFLYELNSSLKLGARRLPYPDTRPFADMFHSIRRQVESLGSIRLRPVLEGPGIRPLLHLFNSALTNHEPAYCFLGLVKAIEYVSVTVARRELHLKMRTRLLSPSALDPDAAFLDSLARLIWSYRPIRDDGDALKLTLQTCCDAVMLAQVAPKIAGRLKATSDASSEKDRLSALSELSTIMSATRNKIAHAKANYRPTGKECPEEQMGALVKCARVAAEQVVGWYCGLPESMRVLGEPLVLED